MPKPLTKWSGSKRRLLPTYLPHFQPAETFTDLFAGSFIVSQHAVSLAPRVVANDINGEWVEAISTLLDSPQEVIEYYEGWLSRWIADGTRSFYNDDMRNAYHFGGLSSQERSALLIAMVQHNFGGLWLCYKKFGYQYSTASGHPPKKVETDRISNFVKDMEGVELSCRSWEEVPLQGFVFADPPYRSDKNHPADYGNEGKVPFQHEALAEALKAHGSFAYCGTDLGDGWFDEHFPRGEYKRVESHIKHTAKRGGYDDVVEVFVYA